MSNVIAVEYISPFPVAHSTDVAARTSSAKRMKNIFDEGKENFCVTPQGKRDTTVRKKVIFRH
jgi:hypothetical protein